MERVLVMIAGSLQCLESGDRRFCHTGRAFQDGLRDEPKNRRQATARPAERADPQMRNPIPEL
jgi:hypothetical protein